MKDALDLHVLKFSKHVESIRKDIECTFGILKQHFHILKHWSQQKFQANIDNIFVACCILHNLILEEDGYLEDNLLLIPDKLSGVMASICHKMYATMTSGEGLWIKKIIIMIGNSKIIKVHLWKKVYGRHVFVIWQRTGILQVKWNCSCIFRKYFSIVLLLQKTMKS